MTEFDSTSAEGRQIVAGGSARGTIRVPSSKSVTHRYLNLALLSGRAVDLKRPLLAADTRLFLGALKASGWEVDEAPTLVRLRPPRRRGVRLRAPVRIDCGNAGTMARFLTASLTALPGDWILDGTDRLRERPVAPLVDALRRLGGTIACLGEEGYLPLRIAGGSLSGGDTVLAAGESSQYLSALLMAGLRAAKPTSVTVEALTSAPYVRMTEVAMSRFGGDAESAGDEYRVRPIPDGGEGLELEVEGDFSAAAYAAAAAALTGGRVRLQGLQRDSAQGDRRTLDLLREMGAKVAWSAATVEVAGGGRLQALEMDLSDIPDQVPTFAALAPFAVGRTRIFNVSHLRLKECDRLAAMATELGRLGVPVEELDDGLVIDGVWADRRPSAEMVRVACYDDHRIAMSLAITGLRRPGVVISEPQVVDKSYPDFWTDFDSLLT